MNTSLPIRVTVIGAGPTGLIVLERLVARALSDATRTWQVDLIEPGELGAGIHQPSLPEHQLANTVCSQLTAFSDEAMVNLRPTLPGPDLFLWSQFSGVQTSRAGEPEREVRFDDHLPRAVLGDYLRWSGQRMLSLVPQNMIVRHHRRLASSVNPVRGQASVTLDDGGRVTADLCVVATGHGQINSAPTRVAGHRSVYPLPQSARDVPDCSDVAVIGTGLSAMDLIAEFTLGRGGSFTGLGDERRYIPSGREPRVTLMNRTGWLPAARPAIAPGRIPTPATHLTEGALSVRAQAESGLDLHRDVWPLIREEMLMRSALSPKPASPALIDKLLETNVDTFPDMTTYRDAVRVRAHRDLREAELGLGESGLKEALEVLRDHREALRTVVSAGDLAVDQHRLFFSELAGLANRLAIGPQRERIEECLLLEQAGIVRLGPGPSPRLLPDGDGWKVVSTHLTAPESMQVDHAFDAHLQWPPPAAEDQPLWQSIAKWSRLAQGRVDVDALGHPLHLDGAPEVAVAVIGPPVEGASYYNHYVPSPGTPCRFRATIDRLLDHAESEPTPVDVAIVPSTSTTQEHV